MSDHTTVVIPHVVTERLLLRGFADGDFEEFATIMGNEEVMYFLGGKPLSRADAWRQMAMFAGHWVLRGFGMWAVVERDTGALIGRVGLHQPHGWPGLEIGYTLGRPWWGRGFAREAAAASLAYAREALVATDVISIIRPENARSIAVATSLGAMPAETIELFGDRAVIYRYPARV